MKKDIVERLREASGYALMDAARVTVLEAAEEIERLRLNGVEREAIAELTDDPDFFGLNRTHTKALRGLLERLK